MAFTRNAFRFLTGLKQHNNKPWFEAHRESYEHDLREPMRALIIEMDGRLKRFAPEIGGDPKRGMFRINRDIRFSRDKSPYKTWAACWFAHRKASTRVGQEAEEGSAGLYFHLQPGECLVGAGLWMPPRPVLGRIRDTIADDPKGFARMVATLKKFGGLDTESVPLLKRMPHGYPEDHPAAKWLRYQSYTAGRAIKDSQAVGAGLPALLEREFKALLPLVRWLNKALKLPA